MFAIPRNFRIALLASPDLLAEAIYFVTDKRAHLFAPAFKARRICIVKRKISF